MFGVSFLVFLENFNCVQETGQGKVPTVGIPLPLLFLRNARKIHESLIIVDEVRLDTPLFGDFGDVGHLVVLCPGDGTRKSPNSRYPSTIPLSQKCQENS